MKHILNVIKRNTGLTQSESVAVLGISVVVLLGWIGQSIIGSPVTHNAEHATRVIELLDSLNRQARSKPPTTEPIEAGMARVDSTSSTASERPRKASTTIHRLSVNTASASQLESLPGVGPATAKSIIAERSRSPFRTVDDLSRVRGIGPKKLEKMRPYIIVP